MTLKEIEELKTNILISQLEREKAEAKLLTQLSVAFEIMMPVFIKQLQMLNGEKKRG